MKHTCNQCFTEMKILTLDHLTGNPPHILCICLNPKCPNYSLYQMPVEALRTETKNEEFPN